MSVGSGRWDWDSEVEQSGMGFRTEDGIRYCGLGLKTDG